MIRRILNSKVIYIIFSLLLAVLLWLYVVNQENPDNVELSFRDVVIQYEGDDDILAAESLSVSSDSDTIDLRLSGRRRELLRLDSSDLYLSVDVSDITEPGVYTLPYKLSLPLGVTATVSDDSPQTVTVTVSRFAEKTIPVTALFNGSVAPGYLADDNISVYPNTIVVSGPAEEVAQVDHARVVLTGTALTETISETLPVTLIGRDGSELSFEEITLSRDNVVVKFPILLQKEVPLTLTLLPGGGATEKNVFVSLSQDTLDIAAEADILNGIDEIEIGTLDLATVEGSGTYVFSLVMPEGVRNLSGVTEVQAEVTIQGLDTKRVETSNIVCVNVSPGYSASAVTKSLTVTLRGSEKELADVTGDDVRVQADLSELGSATGSYTVPARVTVVGTDDVGAVGTYKVTVQQQA